MVTLVLAGFHLLGKVCDGATRNESDWSVPDTVELQWLEHLWNHKNMFETGVVVVVVLFYIHSKHLRSCRDGQLTSPHFSWAGLDLLSG